jgi:hypothetical protein
LRTLKALTPETARTRTRRYVWTVRFVAHRIQNPGPGGPPPVLRCDIFREFSRIFRVLSRTSQSRVNIRATSHLFRRFGPHITVHLLILRY